MEFELSRHDWDSLRSFAGTGASLPAAIRDLVNARTEDEARAASWRIDNVTMVQGRLSQSSTAVASCLVHALWAAVSPAARDRVVDLLAEISGGYEDHVDEELVGPVSLADCMREIRRGLPVYCELLETEQNLSCVDLVLACGEHDERDRPRAAYVFRAALAGPGERRFHDLVEVSLAALESEA